MLNVGTQRTLLIGTRNDDGSLTGASSAVVSQPINVLGCDCVSIYFESVGTTSGGTLKIEEAAFDPTRLHPYSATWSQIGSDQAASGFTGGAQLATHIGPLAIDWIRVKISADITGGGTVLVWLVTRG